MDECISVTGLTKYYKEWRVVDRLTLSVKQKEVFGLLGHNGAGKSTAIDCILALTKMNKGNATVFGMDAKTQRRKLFEKVGVQLQHYAFQDNIKVAELCEEMSALYQHSLDYHELLKQFHLDMFEKHRVEQLSGGEKQKLSLVIALLPNPEVLFLDELTTGLDVAARREVWQILMALKEKGLTIFLTTHYMEEAEKLCDRILILCKGKTIIEGSVSEVIEQSPYDTLEEAYLWYVGEENLV